MMHTPPRLVLGTSLLFWGAMTGRPLFGLLLALVVEGRHWTRVRWEFDDAACERVWQFTVLGIVLATVLIWLDGNRYTALPILLSWLPALLLPMQFIQSYGLSGSIPLGTLSFLAKHRRERNRRFGLPDEGTRFDFGNVLFSTCMVAAAVGSRSSTWLFLPGVVTLSGWMLMSAARSRTVLLAPLVAIAGALAVIGQLTLEEAEQWLGRAAGTSRGRYNPNFVSTLIGTAGTVQQSPDIVWRLQPAPGSPPPRLLRTSSFNTFLGSNWQNQRLTMSDFRDLDTRLIDGEAYYLCHDSEQLPNFPKLASYRLRGTAAAESPLPLPGDASALTGFELDGVERNTLGTVRVFPKEAVIDGTVFWRGSGNPDGPPASSEDLRIPIAERETIRQTLTSLGITNHMPLDEKLARIRRFFHQEFRYTRTLTIRHSPYPINGPTAISRFLTNERAGHCEYFATAAVLMLRDGGIPARYATGYAVMERDPKRGGYVVRGTHGHAWCRVWNHDSGMWIDFDPTPPDWMAGTGNKLTFSQRFNDTLKRLREDFFLWRNRPENRLAVSAVLLLLGTGMAVFIVRRLWRSRRRLEQTARSVATYDGLVIRTPLHDLEKQARKHLGERPPGLTFAQWLGRMRHLLPDGHVLDEAIAIHQRIRFDPQVPASESSNKLTILARDIEASLKKIRR